MITVPTPATRSPATTAPLPSSISRGGRACAGQVQRAPAARAHFERSPSSTVRSTGKSSLAAVSRVAAMGSPSARAPPCGPDGGA